VAKTIIILSDGTGNSANKVNKTNVWRLYRALDLTDSDQVAIYDDGVGTQRFKPLRYLGGAFGYGLSRNVRELYAFLCRNYEPGSHIYMFGFSRGAFTVRTLAGMVVKCGIIIARGPGADLPTGNGLNQAVRKVYKAYRASYRTETGRGLHRCYWALRRGLAFIGAVKPPPADDQKSRIRAFQREYECVIDPEIDFIGVWDTVDAVGLPMDELADFWDKYVYRFRFPDQNLSPLVKQARHALALDDERLTFHPVLWNENPETTGRMKQVWFAGAHSNVGGGYPDDTLAHVPLAWMIGELTAYCERDWAREIRYLEGARKQLIGRQDANGKLYDSRSGLARYYRYKPRDVAKLGQVSEPHDKRVLIETPMIHESVLRRITDQTDTYAPLGVPAEYFVVPAQNAAYQTDMIDGDNTDLPENENEQRELLTQYHEAEDDIRQHRIAILRRAWEVVSKRVVLYHLFLALSLAVLASPAYLGGVNANACDKIGCVLAPVVDLAKTILPGFVGSWLDPLIFHWPLLIGFVLVFALLTVVRWRLSQNTAKAAAAAWRHVITGKHDQPLEMPHGWDKQRAGKDSPLEPIYRQFNRRILPVAVFLLVAGWLIMGVNRIIFDFRAAFGATAICNPSAEIKPLMRDEAQLISPFKTGTPCHPTKIRLEKGETYEFAARADPPWFDKSLAATPDGLSSGFASVALFWAVPARRSWTQSWFALMGQIDSRHKTRFKIGKGPTRITAQRSGELFLYVNDAVICCGSWWDWFYGNNKGAATVIVRKITGVNTQ
jgi:hypothetical protein